MSQQTTRATSRDLFLHFLAMFTLYISAISLCTVFFQITNIQIPDPLVDANNYYLVDNAQRTLRQALSFFIIMFPVCVYSIRLVQKTYDTDKEKAKLGIRKAIIYFTLFVVSFIIMFTLVFLLNHFLDGELTLRFFLKIAATLFVAGAIFGYYRWDLRRFKESTE